jgi:transposase
VIVKEAESSRRELERERESRVELQRSLKAAEESLAAVLLAGENDRASQLGNLYTYFIY